MDGYLLIDKPAGWTSHDVVAKVRSLLRQPESRRSLVASQAQPKTGDSKLETPSPKVKVGHTGTLDPAATGLLILVLGKYTKRAAEFSKMDKVYEVEATLGATSMTGDSEGELTQKSTHRPELEVIEEVLNTFVGEITQVPPTYSAIKVGGQRAYKLARAGKEVALEARPVTIYSIKDVEYTYPMLRFTADVGSGTYIRSLVQDIGAKLGTGAYMSALRRMSVGVYGVNEALSLDNIEFSDIINHVKQIPQ